MNIKNVVKKVGLEDLFPYGYKYVVFPELIKNSKLLFFRKKLCYSNTFIIFKQYSFVNQIINGQQCKRSFSIEMMRNEEEYPNFDFSIQNLNKGSFIYISLSYFLWTIKNERLYNGPYHVWEYLEESELSLALHDAFSATIKYGLPWLENPKSK